MTELMANKKLETRPMNQIITEYDNVIQQLHQQINTYKVESESLIRQVHEVTEENNRLHYDLRCAMESQIKSTTAATTVDLERESYVTLWKQANAEVEGLKKSEIERMSELETFKSDLAVSKKALNVANASVGLLQSKCDQLERDKQKCLVTAQKLDKDVNELQKQLSQTSVQLKAANIKNEDMKSSLEEAKTELKKKSLQLQLTNTRDSSSDYQLHSIKTTNFELEAKCSVLQNKLATLHETKPEMEAEIEVLHERILMMEKREESAVEHVTECVKMTEKAIAEKEQSEFREKQCKQENKELNTMIDTIVVETRAKTRREIEKLKTEYNQKIDKMAEEISLAQKESSEKQARLERAQREKKEIEKELKKMLKQGPQEQLWIKNSLKELRNKLLTVERARDEMATKITSLELARTTDQSKLLQETKQNEQVLEQLALERKRNQTESHDLRQDIASLTEQIKGLQDRNGRLEISLEEKQQKHKKQVAILNEQSMLKEKDLASKAKCSQEAHNKITIDLRELVTAQQTMAVRWREETNSITNKFERVVAELHERLAEEKKRNRDAMDKYNKHKLNNEKLAKKIDRLEQELFQVSQELKDAENRAEHATGQLNVLLLREKKIMKEKRDAQRQLDHAKLQIARNLSIMDPTLPKSAVSFSKSFHGGPTATTFNNTTLYGPTKHYVGFEGLGRGLHSTPRVTGHNRHSKHHLSQMPMNIAKEDLDTSSASSITVLTSQ